MAEILFVVETAPVGGYTDRAVNEDIFTEADDLPGLHANVREAVHCHLGPGIDPDVIMTRKH